LVRCPEEVIDGVLVTDVNLHILDLTVYDLIVGAVDGIELYSINFSALGMPTVNFDHSVFMPLIEADEVNTDPRFAELTKEGEYLIGTMLRAGEWVTTGKFQTISGANTSRLIVSISPLLKQSYIC